MKRKHLLIISAALGGVLLLVLGWYLWIQNFLQGLAYEGAQTFFVGGQPVRIETQSFSVAKGDNGPAKIIVSTGADRTELAAWFNNDFYADVRPGYISWRNVDNAFGLDLLLWRPDSASGADLVASIYISSGDGKLHPLMPPLRRLPWP